VNEQEHDIHPTWNLHAAVAGWLVPGLGHWVLGQRKRAVILAVTIVSLWLAGWLISGVSGFDRHDHFAWFLGQSLIAPSIGVEWWHERIKPPRGTPDPNDTDVAYEPSYGRVSEQGILYTALAGLLNLLAIMDVVYCDAEHRRRPPAAPPADAPTAGDAA
jgi:Family of unknown function (DUF6677)